MRIDSAHPAGTCNHCGEKLTAHVSGNERQVLLACPKGCGMFAFVPLATDLQLRYVAALECVAEVAMQWTRWEAGVADMRLALADLAKVKAEMAAHDAGKGAR